MHRRIFARIFISLAAMFSLKEAYGYANFIGFGYNSCTTCHYNFLGGGPLNDYGRAASANIISDRFLWPSSASENDISSRSNFFFGALKSNIIKPSFDYRGMYFVNNFNRETQQAEWLHMQADAAVALSYKEWAAVISVGYIPTDPNDRTPEGKEVSNLISREHYVSYRHEGGFGVMAGKMDKAFGIRIPDHTAFSRRMPEAQTGNLNDQVHGVLLHYETREFDIAGQYFLGNLEQLERIRHAGFALTGEYSLFDKTRLGASFSRSESEVTGITSYSLHSRIGLGKGSALLFELGRSIRKNLILDSERTRTYVFFQGTQSLARGLYTLYTFEYGQSDSDSDPYDIRVGPGIQWFPVQRIEWRSELVLQRQFNPQLVQKDSVQLLSQLHLSF